MEPTFFNLFSICLAINLAYLALPKFRYFGEVRDYARDRYNELDLAKNEKAEYLNSDPIGFLVYLLKGESIDQTPSFFQDPTTDETNPHQYDVRGGLKVTSKRLFANEGPLLWFWSYRFFRKNLDQISAAVFTLLSLIVMFVISANKIWEGAFWTIECVPNIVFICLFISSLLFTFLPLIFVLVGREFFVRRSKKWIRAAAKKLPNTRQATLHQLQ